MENEIVYIIYEEGYTSFSVFTDMNTAIKICLEYNEYVKYDKFKILPKIIDTSNKIEDIIYKIG